MLTRRIINIQSIGDTQMIKTFTATALKRNTSDLFNAVQSFGVANITNKGRPDMVIMTKEYMNEMLSKLAADLKNKK